MENGATVDAPYRRISTPHAPQPARVDTQAIKARLPSAVRSNARSAATSWDGPSTARDTTTRIGAAIALTHTRNAIMSAGAPGGGAGEHQSERGGRTVRPEPCGDHTDADRGHREPDPLARAGAFVQQQHGEHDGEDGLALHDHRGEAGRHAGPDPLVQERELGHRHRQRGQQEPPPGDRWPPDQEHGRYCGEREPHRVEQQRRLMGQAQPGGDEVDAPHRGDPDRKRDVLRSHEPMLGPANRETPSNSSAATV
jgi:hypothetical protein